MQKGFATQVSLATRDPKTGLMNKETMYHLDEIGQAIVFKLKEHDDRIVKNEEDIESLKKDNELLRRELNEIKRELQASKEILI